MTNQKVINGHVTVPQLFLFVSKVAVIASRALFLLLVIVARHSLEFRRIINADSLLDSFEVTLVERVRFSLMPLFFMHFSCSSGCFSLALLFICSVSAHPI